MSRLLSVNVGLPREVEWQGKLVRIAIWKQSVSHRVFARRLNLDGDGQADLQGHGGEQPSRIAVAVHISALSPGWKSSLAELLKADEKGVHYGNAGLTPSISSLPAWIGFRTLIVVKVHRETSEVTSIVLGAPDGSPLPPALPGQYLVLRLYPDKSSRAIVRSYSISCSSDSGIYRISVKRGTGQGSRYLVDATRIGHKIETSAPRGEFVLRSGTRPVVLMSAGIGAPRFFLCCTLFHRIVPGLLEKCGGYTARAVRRSISL